MSRAPTSSMTARSSASTFWRYRTAPSRPPRRTPAAPDARCRPHARRAQSPSSHVKTARDAPGRDDGLEPGADSAARSSTDAAVGTPHSRSGLAEGRAAPSARAVSTATHEVPPAPETSRWRMPARDQALRRPRTDPAPGLLRDDRYAEAARERGADRLQRRPRSRGHRRAGPAPSQGSGGRTARRRRPGPRARRPPPSTASAPARRRCSPARRRSARTSRTSYVAEASPFSIARWLPSPKPYPRSSAICESSRLIACARSVPPVMAAIRSGARSRFAEQQHRGVDRVEGELRAARRGSARPAPAAWSWLETRHHRSRRARCGPLSSRRCPSPLPSWGHNFTRSPTAVERKWHGQKKTPTSPPEARRCRPVLPSAVATRELPRDRRAAVAYSSRMDLPDEPQIRWILRTTAALLQHGAEPVRGLVQPTVEFFPDAFDGSPKTVAALMLRVQEHRRAPGSPGGARGGHPGGAGQHRELLERRVRRDGAGVEAGARRSARRRRRTGSRSPRASSATPRCSRRRSCAPWRTCS